MLTHLANPWILARMVLGVAACALAATAGFGAVGVFLRYNASGPPDERTLVLERRSELVAVTLQVAFVLELAASVLTIVAADRMAGSIRGAMCAFGVFDIYKNPDISRSLEEYRRHLEKYAVAGG